MNTDSLAKLYDTLRPCERLPLIVAAAVRGDEIEKQRLLASVPKVAFEVTDHFGLAQALGEAVDFHLLTLLDLAANFWEWWGLWRAHDLPGRSEALPKPGKHGKAGAAQAGACRSGCVVRYFAYRFTAHVDGWRRFCAEMHINAEILLNFMPGRDMITRTEKHARDLAFMPDEAAMFLWSERVHPEGVECKDRIPEAETAEGLAQVWHEFLDKRLQWWGSSVDRESAALCAQGKPQWEIPRQLKCNQGTASNDLAAIGKASTPRDFDAKTAETPAKFDRLEAEAWAAWEDSCRGAGATHQRTEFVGRQAGDAGPVSVKGFIEKTNGQVGDPRFLEQIFVCIETRQKMLGLRKGTPIEANRAVIDWDELCSIPDRTRTDPIEEAITRAALPDSSAASGISAAACSALGESLNGKQVSSLKAHGESP